MIFFVFTSKVNELKQFLVNNNTYEPLQKSIAMVSIFSIILFPADH